MRLLAFVFLMLGCSKVLTNHMDEQRYLCGSDLESGNDYIKISNEENLVSFSKDIPTTSKGCVARPKTGEVLITNVGRTSGVWLNSESKKEVSLEPLLGSQLPSACNSVVHGDGRGFNLNFDLKEAGRYQDLQKIEIKILAQNGAEVASWPMRDLSETLVYQFDSNRPVLSGEYRLFASISDRVSGAASKSECTLRIDYSELLISPAENVKTKRTFNGQEVLVVQPGYNVNFYVHEGFRDVSIEYCLKQLSSSDVGPNMDPALLKCETPQNFLNTKSPSLDQGFWVLNYRGQRGLVQNAWQHSVFMVEKVCVGAVSTPDELVGKGCTTIRGALTLGEQFSPKDFHSLDSIVTVYGDIKIGGVNQPIYEDFSVLPNLEEIYGNLEIKANYQRVKFMPSLRNVWGNLRNSFSIHADLESEYFSKLVVISGDLNLDLASFALNPVYFPELRLVEGRVQLQGGFTKEINFLPKLEVAGTIRLSSIRDLENVDGLRSLRSVESLHLSDLYDLKSLKGLSGIKRLRELDGKNLSVLRDFSDLQISDVDAVALEGLPELTAFSARKIIVNKNLYISRTPKLADLKSFEFNSSIEFLSLFEESVKSFEGLENIETIDYTLTLEQLPGITDFSPFKNLSKVNDFTSTRTGLRNFDAFKNLESISYLNFEGQGDSEISLSSLRRVSVVTIKACKNIDFGSFAPEDPITLMTLNNNSFIDLTFFSESIKVETLELFGNPNLESLRGVEKLRTLTGGISLGKNPKLLNTEDLEKLAEVGTITSDVDFK